MSGRWETSSIRDTGEHHAGLQSSTRKIGDLERHARENAEKEQSDNDSDGEYAFDKNSARTAEKEAIEKRMIRDYKKFESIMQEFYDYQEKHGKLKYRAFEDSTFDLTEESIDTIKTHSDYMRGWHFATRGYLSDFDDASRPEEEFQSLRVSIRERLKIFDKDVQAFERRAEHLETTDDSRIPDNVSEIEDSNPYYVSGAYILGKYLTDEHWRDNDTVAQA